MRKLIGYTIVIIFGLILLNTIAEIHRSIYGGITTPIVDAEMLWKYFYISLLSISFGVLIEWQRVVSIFKDKVKVNWLIIPTIILAILSLMPFNTTLYWVGIASYHNFPLGILFAPLQDTHTLIMLGILTGILLTRSIVRKSDNQ